MTAGSIIRLQANIRQKKGQIIQLRKRIIIGNNELHKCFRHREVLDDELQILNTQTVVDKKSIMELKAKERAKELLKKEIQVAMAESSKLQSA